MKQFDYVRPATVAEENPLPLTRSVPENTIPGVKTNSDALVGDEAYVLELVDGRDGRVKVGGESGGHRAGGRGRGRRHKSGGPVVIPQRFEGDPVPAGSQRGLELLRKAADEAAAGWDTLKASTRAMALAMFR